MDTRTRLIIVGAVALFILLAVVGIILYLSRVSPGRITVPTGPTTDLSGRLPTVAPSATPSATPAAGGQPLGTTGTTGSTSTGLKNYTGPGFSLSYPANWGLLTCVNSSNFEFDPVSGTDALGTTCDIALKPVTVMVTDQQLSCPGEAVTIGSRQVARQKTNNADGVTAYRWCVPVGGRTLDITHRVSSTGSRATSPTDYALQVEQMIGSITTSP